MSDMIAYGLLVIISAVYTSSQQLVSNLNTTTCEFNFINADTVQEEFEAQVKVDNVWMISFDISLNSEFENITNYDELHKNGISRWIWVSEQHQNILSYPADFDAISFQLSKAVQRTITVVANATLRVNEFDPENYTVCTEAIYRTFTDVVLNMNKTNWKFCHRYFQGQEWKKSLYEVTGSWLGYDFACFDAIRTNVGSEDYISKGIVNIVIDIFIIILCLYLPLFYSLLPDRHNTDSKKVQFYKRGDCPYSFARLIFRLHEVPCKKSGTTTSVVDWLKNIYDEITNLKPEIIMFSLFYFINLGIYILDDIYLKKAIPDYSKFPDVYLHPDPDETLAYKAFFLTLGYCMFIPLAILTMSYFTQSESTYLSLHPFGRHKVRDILKNSDESEKYVGYTKFSMKFFDRISLFFTPELWKQTLSPLINYKSCADSSSNYDLCMSRLLNFGLFVFNSIALSILTAINSMLFVLFLLFPSFYYVLDCFVVLPIKVLFQASKIHLLNFKPAFYILLCIGFLAYVGVFFYIFFQSYFLFLIQFIFRGIIYLLFVAGPLFSNISNNYQLWTIILSVVIYFLKYTFAFHQHYKNFLDKLLDINKTISISDNVDETSRILRPMPHSISSHERENFQIQMSDSSTDLPNKPEKIRVTVFDEIAKKYLPLRHELFKFFLKIIITGLFLYVTLDSIEKGSYDKFTTSQIPQIITVALPAIAERFCTPLDIKNNIDLHEEDIKEDLRIHYSLKSTSIRDGLSEEENREQHVSLKMLYNCFFPFMCPILHTICSCMGSFFRFCSDSTNDQNGDSTDEQNGDSTNEQNGDNVCPEDLQICCFNDNRKQNEYQNIDNQSMSRA